MTYTKENLIHQMRDMHMLKECLRCSLDYTMNSSEEITGVLYQPIFMENMMFMERQAM